MKRITIFCILSLMVFRANCAIMMKADESTDSVAVLYRYMLALDSLAQERDSLNSAGSDSPLNAYYYQVLLHPTLYSSPLHQMMSLDEQSCLDPQMQRLYASRRMLSQLYTRTPQLVTQTESDIMGQTALRTDVNEVLHDKDKLSDKVAAATLAPVVDEAVEVITRRPNFWKFSGDVSLTFSQNYFSGNWYQGGEDNYQGMTSLTMRANYNDQRKFTWDNTLEMQLGFQTTESDTERSFRPTNNLLRYTTNAGYKAWKNFHYSLQSIFKTQLVPTYRTNSDVKTSDILSPLEITIAPGLRYDIAWGKKKKFTGQINMAALAMKVLYVHEDDLVKNYGIDEGSNHTITFGPNITLNTTWQICKQINWNVRMYWMSNYDYNIWEWENTINFSVTKLIWAKLYIYPRFDNSNERYRSGENHDGTFMMFKEWFSLGLNYSF